VKGNGSNYFGDWGVDRRVKIIRIFKELGVRRRAGYTCVWLMGYCDSDVKMAVILCVSSESF
jgi:hypothetical protein